MNETIPLFFVGQNRAGAWVARTIDGQAGVSFADRASAMNFVKTEGGTRGYAAVLVDGPIDLPD